ncbi:MAG: hypothetical protein UV82_C0018G0007 [Candidatus Magasanikbacteria bacterium GW2011_GWD2_43_18]|nr:MAG: hypothetical protein UV82_C0018G0007 [Candidatus Magasanikbacteria bacterium GW2011_GWD2_43_18]
MQGDTGDFFIVISINQDTLKTYVSKSFVSKRMAIILLLEQQ